eukprot:TRINITY_DN8551_c0_g1_i2.p1 TRINITY_DN8551_c0_g1~~TRINITY_DN8551_c0_g1_i2.p1  ORF type:complete len:243 (-),score=64.41 TRINITY_DN8551_c0_g1_i2:44-724(-)
MSRRLEKDFGTCLSIFVTEVAEVAESCEADGAQDMVELLENQVIDIVDIQRQTEHAVKALKEVKAMLSKADFNKDEDLALFYEQRVEQLSENSNPQQYLKGNGLYRDFKQRVWAINHEGEALPEEFQDEELVVMTQTDDTDNFTFCPITREVMTDPVRNDPCGHAYSREAIMQHLRKSKKCPIAACSSLVSKNSLSDDPVLATKIKRALRKNKRKRPEYDEVVDDL